MNIVHEDDGACLRIGNGDRTCLCRAAVAPVNRVHIPEGNCLVAGADDGSNTVIGRAVRRAHPLRVTSTGLFDSRICGIDLVRHAGIAQRGELRVVQCVIANIMPLVMQALHNLRISFGISADEEERGVDALLLQYVQEHIGVRYRAIVIGDSHAVFAPHLLKLIDLTRGRRNQRGNRFQLQWQSGSANAERWRRVLIQGV